MKRTTIPLIICLLAIAGCGGQSHHATAPKPSAAIVTGEFCSGLTDKCVALPAKPRVSLQSARGRIPDVSSFQGHPNWAAAKAAGIAGGIFKGGEFTTDPDAAFNNAQLRALHLWRAMYWFVRNTGCSHEAGQIISLARSLGVVVVINDLETPEARGYSSCLVPAERAAHLTPVDYTAPGTWPGGSGFGIAPLWQAEYGPTLHPFWHPVLAWQCTDGVSGCVTFVPGIGTDDVSVNLGITKLGAPPTPKPKPKPHPKPGPSFNENFTGGFLRGFTVGYDRRHHRKVPAPTFASGNRVAFNTGFRDGFQAGWKA